MLSLSLSPEQSSSKGLGDPQVPLILSCWGVVRRDETPKGMVSAALRRGTQL